MSLQGVIRKEEEVAVCVVEKSKRKEGKSCCASRNTAASEAFVPLLLPLPLLQSYDDELYFDSLSFLLV